MRNRSRDRVLGERVEVASTFLRRLRGLSGRKSWGDLDGLWIEPCAGVHALGMRFAIDVVLVDDSHTVLSVQENLRPFRLGKLHLDAHAALELPAGRIARTETKVGDVLSIGAPMEEKSSTLSTTPRRITQEESS